MVIKRTNSEDICACLNPAKSWRYGDKNNPLCSDTYVSTLCKVEEFSEDFTSIKSERKLFKAFKVN